MTYELAEKFLEEAEGFIEQEDAEKFLLEKLDEANQANPDNALILCRSARLLFRYGVLNSKGRFFLLALDKLKLAAEKNPPFFNAHYVWWQLWGNILFQLGKLIDESSFLELSLEKYEHALKCCSQKDPYLLWDYGEGWILLGKKSGEISDLKQGVAQFVLAEKAGQRSPFFFLDYAQALSIYGVHLGDPTILDETINYLKTLIAETYQHQENHSSIAHLVAWRKIALAAKTKYQLSHRSDHFNEADKMLREAILAAPKIGELWLDWSLLFFHAGWVRRDVKLVEIGLEKLTAIRVKECDPIRVSYLLGIGLLLYGLYLENFNLLREGRERIQAASAAASTSSDFSFAQGFAELCYGLYFDDTDFFSKAEALLTQELERNNQSIETWYALFQTYFFWGIHGEDESLLKHGLKCIERVCELRPHSGVHHHELGTTLLNLRDFEEDPEKMQIWIEKAIFSFQKAWELNEEEENLYHWGCAYDILGNLTAEEGHYEKAIDLLSKALEKKPNQLCIRYHLGLSLSHLGELLANPDCLSQAIDLLEIVIKIESDNENIWNEYGYTLLNFSEAIHDPIYPQEGERRRRDAEKALLKAVELGSADAFYHLACLYALSDLHHASLYYLQKAAEAGSLPTMEDLEQDEWLDGLRETQAFRDFLNTQGKNG